MAKTPEEIVENHFRTKQTGDSKESAVSETRYRRLFETSRDGILILDADNANIVDVNPFLLELLGFRKEQIVGQKLWEIGLFNDTTSSKMAFFELQDKEFIRYEDLPLITANGRRIDVEFISNVYIENDSKMIQCNIRDNTEKRKQHTTLERNQKLESLGLLAGSVAHYFNNLLCGIFGYLELANDSLAEGKYNVTREKIDKTFLVFERAKALTRKLLTFSNGGAPCRKKIRMAPFIKECVQNILSGANVSGNFAIAEDLWMCNCDEAQIEQVISNLVINASYSMPAGRGTIFITADNITIAAGEDAHPDTLAHQRKFVRFSIKDTGTGIPGEIMERIYDPFFTTKETAHGLGLAIVFSIVKQHNGWIHAESEPGTGSTFTVFIPAVEEPFSFRTVQNKTVYHGNKTVLVMDDEQFMIDVITGMLRKIGYTVVPARNGDEALMLFMEAEESGEPFLASILDLTVKNGMSGREIVAAIRNINRERVVIASSGYSADPIMLTPMEYGFTESIAKPFRKADLFELFNRLFDLERSV